MLEGTRRLRHVVCLVVGVLAVTVASDATASPEGAVAAALVQEASYRHILDDTLYTHAGNDRDAWYGADLVAARYSIRDQMLSFGLVVTLEPFDFYGNTGYNVVGTKWGVTDDSIEYVIGSHYDSYCGGCGSAAGADDNASGTALVLEAARVLSAYDSAYTIRFVAFDAEEYGLWGSEAYVDAHITDDIRGMISADMVAWNRDGASNVDVFGFDASNPHKLAVAQAISTYGEGVTPLFGGPSSGSDHYPFELAGFQACLVIEDWGNPYYHTQEDNVDMPGYIDYEFATQITRGVVGFLVDNAGVHVTIPDADYDVDGDVDGDDFDAFSACFSGPGISPDPGCEFFDLDGDDDVDCVDSDLFAAVWSVPGDPPVYWPCIQIPAGVESLTSRCLSVTPPEHGLPVALLVTGDADDPDVACLSEYVQPSGGLAPTPAFQTYDVWGTIEVCHESIVGDTYYHVSCDYGEPGSPVLSSPASVITPIWGDVVGGEFVGGEWEPPDDVIDFNDITAAVEVFVGYPWAPPVYRADLIGSEPNMCMPNAVVDFDDISSVVDAFRMLSYWVSSGCPSPCE